MGVSFVSEQQSHLCVDVSIDPGQTDVSKFHHETRRVGDEFNCTSCFSTGKLWRYDNLGVRTRDNAIPQSPWSSRLLPREIGKRPDLRTPRQSCLLFHHSCPSRWSCP